MADISKMRDLCNVLGLNLLQRIQDEVDGSVSDIDSWLVSDLGDETVNLLNSSVERLCKMKADRFSEIKKKALAIIAFWDTLLVPFEKKQEFINLVYFGQVESDDEITEVSALSLEFLNKVVQEHDKLREQLDGLVLKKKSKLMQILKATHLLSKFVDNKDIVDPIAAFLDMKARISEAQNLASQRAEIVTKIEFIQHAVEEIDWYKQSEKTGVPLQDERSIKAKILQKGLPKILRNVQAELARRGTEPFIYDERDVLNMLKDIEDKATSAGTSTLDKAGTSTAVGIHDMEVEPAQVEPAAQVLHPQQPAAQVLQPLQPAAQVLQPLQPAAPVQHGEMLPLQPAQLLPLFPLPPPHFGFVPRAPRTRRELVLPPAPPSPPSPPTPPSPPDSNYDPTQDLSDDDDVDYDPTQDL